MLAAATLGGFYIWCFHEYMMVAFIESRTGGPRPAREQLQRPAPTQWNSNCAMAAVLCAAKRNKWLTRSRLWGVRRFFSNQAPRYPSCQCEQIITLKLIASDPMRWHRRSPNTPAIFRRSRYNSSTWCDQNDPQAIWSFSVGTELKETTPISYILIVKPNHILRSATFANLG